MIDTHAIRCRVLQLALAGELTERNEADGTGEELLRSIGFNGGQIESDLTPYTLPTSWAWARLKDVYTINPRVTAPDEGDAAFIPMERIDAGFTNSFSYVTQTWARASKNHSRFADNDVAFAKISPSFENRKSFIASGLPNGVGGGTTELIVLRQKEMLPEYTQLLVLDQRFIDAGSEQFRGIVGQQRVKLDVVKKYLIPIAPYQEQIRIVSRVREIFSYLDEIDELQRLFSENSESLKRKIQDAGICGDLTAEWRAQQGVNKDCWKETTIGSCFDVVGGIQKTPARTPKDNPVPYVTVANVFRDRIDLSNIKCFELFEGELERYKLKDRDILTVEGNGSDGEIGRCAIWESQIPVCVHQNHIIRLRVTNDQVSPEYVLLYLNSPIGQSVVRERAKTTTGLYNLSAGKIRAIPLPLPSLSEQRQIVERVNELLAALPN